MKKNLYVKSIGTKVVDIEKVYIGETKVELVQVSKDFLMKHGIKFELDNTVNFKNINEFLKNNPSIV